MNDRIFTVPNLISMLRLLCIPLFVWILFGAENRSMAAILLAILGATDWIDGWIARRFNQISELGKILDPTADRLLLIVAIPSLMIDGSIPVWFALFALVRELLVGGGTVALALIGARRIDVLWWGKTGTFAMLFAVPCFLAGESTISISSFFAVLAYISGIPGLLISWFAAFMYLPLASEALKEIRDNK
jgi:cardiolipin synthase